MLIRFNFLIDKAQIDYLRSLSSNVSEHIRRAIDDYIDKLEFKNISSSQSKRGGSDE